jgi:1-deoxy-D-xylulose-5-phosphate synthase
MDNPRILDTIDSPSRLRELAPPQLVQLAHEIRTTVIETVSRHGGHLASNLGVAELAIALHYAFDFRKDRLLWDIGHQCYPHKLLTGRAGRFDTLRQSGGLSGFPSPAESEYDLFYTGHAGTALSTAMGLAWADRGTSHRVVTVVGDAGIVNGVSFEALNNIAALRRQFLIVLNDNSMAIDPTRGALAKALDRIRMDRRYSDLKQSAESMIQRLPLGDEISEAIRHLKQSVKSTVHGGQIFETLGISYFGPVDGHDLPMLIRVLSSLADIDGPVLLHVRTQKGKGCRYAVEDPCRFHSPAAYVHQGDRAIIKPRTVPTWTKVFSEAMVDLGRRNDKVVAITAAMPDGTGLAAFREEFPDRFIDVGMNESHAVAMAAGIAREGLRPIVAIYSTFMQRAFDQVFQEAALQRLPVTLCMDRAGLVGSDGAVHHGFADIAFLRPLPGMVLMAPADAAELSAALDLAVTLDGPCAVRYPRDEVALELAGECPPFVVGKSRTVRQGSRGAIIAYGATVETALAAADILASQHGLEVDVVNARFAKPLDMDAFAPLIASGKAVLVCEDHAVAGGFGSAVLEAAAHRGLNAANVRLAGIPDAFIPHASRTEQTVRAGLDPATIAARLAEAIGSVARASRYA